MKQKNMKIMSDLKSEQEALLKKYTDAGGNNAQILHDMQEVIAGLSYEIKELIAYK